YFDHSVARTDRQWFFFIGRPSSTVVVEIGLKSEEGYFVRVARSGRTDFPRRERVSPGRVEWLTVRSARGGVGEPVTDNREVPSLINGGAGLTAQAEPVRVWDIRRTHAGSDDGWIRDESFGTMWHEAREWVREQAATWQGPIIRTTWEAGPFVYPVELPRYVEERYEGTATVRSVDGRSHIIYGPWQVVIRGLGARAERRILAVWEVHRSWIADAGIAVRTMGGAASTGGSEQLVLGASELR